jgi:beta-glucosidase
VNVETGEFDILIEKSSKDIVLKDSLCVQSTVLVKKPVHRNTTIGDLLPDPILAPVARQLLPKMKKDNKGKIAIFKSCIANTKAKWE